MSDTNIPETTLLSDTSSNVGLERRDFLKQTGLAAGGMAAIAAIPGMASAATAAAGPSDIVKWNTATAAMAMKRSNCMSMFIYVPLRG
jgi:hypothetical protein